MRRLLLTACLLLALAPAAAAKTVYQTRDAFLANAFPDGVPAPKAVWMTGEVRKRGKAILGRAPMQTRVRYWRRDGRTAWVLEDIGKYKPITTGVVIENGAIRRVQVLVYRETHGYEVHNDWFTKQFRGARLTGDGELTNTVDGISGATLSVRALKQIAAFALYLHGRVTDDGG